jgi:peptidoglycan/xylan/chitin deacetylase (PgdA/CDA1 family)
MYHVIALPPAGAPFPGLYVSPHSFSVQMSWLARHGFHAVTLRAVYDHWKGRRPLPRHPIVLTFDDGYRSDYRAALPVLRSHGWPGVLNLEVHNLTVSWGLSPGRVRRLIAAGWEVDAHTITHPDLTKVDSEQLRREVAGSRATIRRRFGVPVDFFCYPAGRYDAAVVAEVRRAGYLGATTTQIGLARPSELYTLPRVRVSGGDGVAGLAARLAALGVAGA